MSKFDAKRCMEQDSGKCLCGDDQVELLRGEPDMDRYYPVYIQGKNLYWLASAGDLRNLPRKKKVRVAVYVDRERKAVVGVAVAASLEHGMLQSQYVNRAACAILEGEVNLDD